MVDYGAAENFGILYTRQSQHEDIIGWFSRQDIFNVERGVVQPNARGYQVDTLVRLADGENVALNTARQQGSTTILTSFAVWKASKIASQRIVIVVPSSASVNSIMDRFKLVAKQANAVFTKNIVGFPNGSQIYVKWAHEDLMLPGIDIDLLAMDDAAMIEPNLSLKIWEYVRPTVKPSGQIIVASSPGIAKGLFWEIWSQAVSCGTNNTFVPIMWPWSVNHQLDYRWAQRVKETLGNEIFGQQFECRFTHP